MPKPLVKKVKHCRVCKKKGLKRFLSLGIMPSVNNFLTAYQLNKPEHKFPLNVCYCGNCGMVELEEVVSPKYMFTNYVYISSFSKTMLKHFEDLATSLVERFGLNSSILVTEIGSNDGTLLKFFKSAGVKVLGIDPAKNLAKLANDNGIETWNDFFNAKLSRKIVKKKGLSTIIVGTNVFAHIDNLDDVLNGLDIALSEDGVFVAEFPYLLNLVEGLQFDTIYHEHLSYFALKPLMHLFNRFSFEIFDVQRIPVHGGSIRIFVGKRKAKRTFSKFLKELLDLEENVGLYDPCTLKKFANDVKTIKKDLRKLLISLRKNGKRVAGFGAPAKGNILLNYCEIDNRLLSYVTDNIPYKQGLYTPGTHLQVFPEEKIIEDKPDYLLLLPWNFKEEILNKLADFRRSGGRIIVPIPRVEVL